MLRRSSACWLRAPSEDRRLNMTRTVRLTVVSIVTLTLSLGSKGPSDASDPGASSVRKIQIGNYAAGSPIHDDQALGGFASSGNMPQRITDDMKYVRGRLQLIAQPQANESVSGGGGMRLLLINATAEQVALQATDSRLAIVQEAKDESGNWQAIEAAPSSWCGNSYHRIFLPAGQYWSFLAPVYDGDFATTLRFHLDGIDGGRSVYSHEFAGSINLEQFTGRGHRRPSLP
jgi:hypothetical protein